MPHWATELTTFSQALTRVALVRGCWRPLVGVMSITESLRAARERLDEGCGKCSGT